jgi:hypothetical protein
MEELLKTVSIKRKLVFCFGRVQSIYFLTVNLGIMSATLSDRLLRGISWRQPLVCAATTGVCTVLAIWAVVAAPVAPAPGVSGRI